MNDPTTDTGPIDKVPGVTSTRTAHTPDRASSTAGLDAIRYRVIRPTAPEADDTTPEARP